MSWVSTAKLGACFFTWFFLNVMYNITNKKCQNAFPMPWTMTFVSLAVGARRTRGRRHAHARARSRISFILSAFGRSAGGPTAAAHPAPPAARAGDFSRRHLPRAPPHTI